jgi:hypothetical protein
MHGIIMACYLKLWVECGVLTSLQFMCAICCCFALPTPAGWDGPHALPHWTSAQTGTATGTVARA